MIKLKHLENENTIFSLQTDEALNIYSLVKIINPKTIVEFGFYKGFSAKNFLAAMSKDSSLYSFDPYTACLKFTKKIKDKRFKFFLKTGEQFDTRDINNKLIDFVLFDASHNFASNINIFNKIKPYLSSNCIIAIHDTGLYNQSINKEKWTTPEGFFVNEGYAHQPQERVFVNYLKKKHPKYQQIHFHSMRTARMGLTILQKYQHLDVGKIENKIILNYVINKNLIEIKKILKTIFNL